MYAPEHFRERNPRRMLRLIETHSFAVLVSQFAGELQATHVPLLMGGSRDADGLPTLLVGHLSAGNPHGAAVAGGAPTVAVFSGDDAYITPRWYGSEPDVPTWNYAAVHVHGRLRPIADRAEVHALLRRTVDHYEADATRPWSIDDIPRSVVDGFQKGVTAFALAIDRISAIRKLSQDKSGPDQAAVASGLRQRGRPMDAAVAGDMEQKGP